MQWKWAGGYTVGAGRWAGYGIAVTRRQRGGAVTARTGVCGRYGGWAAMELAVRQSTVSSKRVVCQHTTTSRTETGRRMRQVQGKGMSSSQIQWRQTCVAQRAMLPAGARCGVVGKLHQSGSVHTVPTKGNNRTTGNGPQNCNGITNLNNGIIIPPSNVT